MSRHHPDAETLLHYVAGTLAPGLAAVVAVHLEGCAECRAREAELCAAGGVLLEDLEPAAMAPDAFAHVVARLGDVPVPRAAHVPRQNLILPDGVKLPAALRGCDIGRWLWIGHGVRFSKVRLPWSPDSNVFLLRVAANRRVITHSHGEVEFTHVLQGGFSDVTGDYDAGDLAEADASLEHQPVAGPEGCLCLAALEGGMRLPWLLRWRAG
jgi:putative transcriptional regulator